MLRALLPSVPRIRSCQRPDLDRRTIDNHCKGATAHDRAFAFFKGTCTRGIHDNMKTVVERMFVDMERAYIRRFLQMCGHYLDDPVAVYRRRATRCQIGDKDQTPSRLSC